MIIKIISSINEYVGKIIGFLIFPLIAIILFEVVSRFFWDAPTNWVHESSGILFATMGMLAGGYVLMRNGHIKVDVIYEKFPLRVRAILDVLTAVVLFVLCAVLIWKGGDYAWDSFLRQETSKTGFDPLLWPVRALIPAGAFLLLLQAIAQFALNLKTAITGKAQS